MTAVEAVRELFARLPVPGKDLVWFVDEFIAVVQHIGSVSLEVARDSSGSSSLLCRSDSTTLSIPGRGSTSLFRPMLARLAVVGSDETGTEFQPYGGRYTLTRSSRSGPVRLEIDFTNTPATQRLTIARILVTATPRPAETPDSAIAGPKTQPSA
jgi:hypothetical protein